MTQSFGNIHKSEHYQGRVWNHLGDM